MCYKVAQRQNNAESAAFSDLAFNADPSARHFNEFFYDRQTDARALIDHASGYLILKKSVKYLFKILFRYPYAAVGYTDLDPAILHFVPGSYRHCYPSIFRSKLES